MVIALDIGGTNIRIAQVSGSKVSNKKTVLNPRIQQITIHRIFDLISKFKNTKKICVATAGFEQQGLIQGSPNTSLNGVPLRSILQKKYNAKIYIQNDARCAALSELKYGHGKKLKNFVILTLGTGIGGVIVINKKLYLGQGTAGEIGQVILNEKTFGQLSSGTTFTETHNSQLIAKNLGIGLANLAHVLSPDAFIIGGGFSNHSEIFPIAQAIFKENYKFHNIPIIKAKFPEDGGLIGASLLPIKQ